MKTRYLIPILVIVLLVTTAQTCFLSQLLEPSAPIPVGSEQRYAGIPQGFTQQGFPQLGSPDAPVRVDEFSDFACPHCASDFHDKVLPALIERTRTGEITFVFIPIPVVTNANGEGAARAALCAGKQSAFWTYHDYLFLLQRDYALQAFSQNRLLAGIDQLGLDRTQFDQCMSSSFPQQVLDAGIKEGKSMGSDFTGVPTVRVQGAIVKDQQNNISYALDDINRAIDAALHSP